MFRLALLLAAVLGLAASLSAQPFESRHLLSFGQRDPQGGTNPEDPPIVGADGALYGATRRGGTFAQGVIYRIDPATDTLRVLFHFTGGALDGGKPWGSSLCQLDDGRIYGLCVNARLLMFSIRPDGTDFKLHFTFPAGAEVGGVFNLTNWLRPGPGGLLYGVYHTGGANTPPSQSHLFRIARDGTGFQPLGQVTSGTSPLSVDAAGRLFGTTESSVFRLEADGKNFVTLVNFPPPAFGTVIAEGGVLHHSNGFLYGFTAKGGASGRGMFYRLRPDGTQFQVLFEPAVITDSGHLRSPSFESDDGFIYGAAGEDGFGTQSLLWKIRPDGTGFQIFKRLNFSASRGTCGMTQAPNGQLYSFTTANPDGNALFRIARDGTGFTVIHRFSTSQVFPVSPIALVRGPDQRFYGLTAEDGTGGRGTLFRCSPDGSNFAVVRDFGVGSAAEQGIAPKALCVGTDGSLYGIVRQVGSVGAGIFRYVVASGQFSWIQMLPTGQTADYAGLLQSASDGLLYAGIDSSPVKTERIVRLHPSGTGFTVLRTLTSTAASFSGSAPLAEGPDGLLYGITMRNGAATLPLLFRIARDGSGFQALTEINAGTFSAGTPRGLLVTPAGQVFGYASTAFWRCQTDGSGFAVLKEFATTAFGETPLLGFDGRIYGTLRVGPGGGLFRIDPAGTNYEEIVSFPSSTVEPLTGRFPSGSLIAGPDGAFYGLTTAGGFANRGTLYRVATAAQVVGFAEGTFGLDQLGRFAGTVAGPEGRPIDVQRSDDLQTWTTLPRLPGPGNFVDPAPATTRRFYRAVAP